MEHAKDFSVVSWAARNWEMMLLAMRGNGSWQIQGFWDYGGPFEFFRPPLPGIPVSEALLV